MENLNTYRDKIDTIDNEIIDLLWKRFEIIWKIWIYKKENNIKTIQSNRWQEVLANAKKIWVERGLDPVLVWVLWNTIHEFAIKTEDIIKKQ